MRVFTVSTASCAILLTISTKILAQNVMLPATDRILQFTESDVYRIGGSNAPEWAAFNDLRAVAFDSAGTLYAMETRGGRIIKVRNNGTFVGQLGRKGEGPGEFSAPTAMAVFPDGRVFVRDLAKTAFLRFDSNGKAGAELSATFPNGDVRRIAPSGSGFLAWSSDVVIIGNMRVISGLYDTPATSLPLGVVSLADGRVRTTMNAWLPPYVTPRERFARALLAPTVSWTALEGGSIAVADSLSWRITIASNGGAKRSIVRPLGQRRTSAADRAWAMADYRARMIDPSGRPRIGGVGAPGAPPPAILVAEVERGIAASTVADELQIIRRLGTDWVNRIWVQRVGASMETPGPIDIVESSGAYVGTLVSARFPDAFGPDGLVAYLERDVNDAQVVVVRKLTLSSVR